MAEAHHEGKHKQSMPEKQADRIERKSEHKAGAEASHGMGELNKSIVAEVLKKRQERKSGGTDQLNKDDHKCKRVASADELLPLGKPNNADKAPLQLQVTEATGQHSKLETPQHKPETEPKRAEPPNIERAREAALKAVQAISSGKLYEGVTVFTGVKEHIAPEPLAVKNRFVPAGTPLEIRGHVYPLNELTAQNTDRASVGGNGALPDRPASREFSKSENPVSTAGDFIKNQLIEQAKERVGQVHGTINFAVNTLGGLGDLVRMGAAANRELSPLSLISKDIDPEGTKKLHDACSGLAIGSRVLLQYSTTFNPISPLFRVNFDPEGSQMAMKLAFNMPGKLKQEIDDYGKLNTEAKSAKSTELMLNITSLAAGGLGAASKGGELSKVGTAAKTLEELSGAAKASEMANDGKLLANVAKDVQSFMAEQSKHLDKIAKAFDKYFPRFPQHDMLPADGPSIRYARESEQLAPAKKGDNVVYSTADKGNEAGGFRGRGMDSTGKPLSFSNESGIELGSVRQGQDKVWEQAPFPRGDDVHVVLGENLPAGTKTIDRLVFKDGIVESQKSIDLTAPSYESPQKLESKLTDYVHKLEIYKGQPVERAGVKFVEDDIQSKVLHVGIKDGSMTAEQKTVFEKIGRSVQKYNDNLLMGKAPIKLKVTIVK